MSYTKIRLTWCIARVDKKVKENRTKFYATLGSPLELGGVIEEESRLRGALQLQTYFLELLKSQYSKEPISYVVDIC